MSKPITKTASHDTDHECHYWPSHGDIQSHVPGVEVRVQWSSGRAQQAKEALDAAVAEVRAQIIDGEESR